MMRMRKMGMTMSLKRGRCRPLEPMEGCLLPKWRACHTPGKKGSGARLVWQQCLHQGRRISSPKKLPLVKPQTDGFFPEEQKSSYQSALHSALCGSSFDVGCRGINDVVPCDQCGGHHFTLGGGGKRWHGESCLISVDVRESIYEKFGRGKDPMSYHCAVLVGGGSGERFDTVNEGIEECSDDDCAA